MKIPYGTCDFGTIRADGLFYVDKTPFLPVLESAESGYRHLLFLRPRRFGKSTLLSMLAHYYDIDRKEQFDELFKGLWIHEHPTPEQGRYLVLLLDFSRVTAEGDLEALRDNFCEALKASLRTFFMQYGARIPQLAAMYDTLDRYRDAAGLMANVLGIIAGTRYKLYVLIDEYDSFANQLLSGGSTELYEKAIVDRMGFVRGFYATLKGGTANALARMFITGVTPLMLNDLASGFNIVTPIALSPRFNALAGFTHADVERAVSEFLAARPHLASLPEVGDPARLVGELETYYDGYRFSPDASERVFNSDMVLYFLRELHDTERYPRDMLDQNVRTEYRYLQRIGTLTGTDVAERRELLETILMEEGAESSLVREFGASSLSSKTQFISLLYYLGMLTLGAATAGGITYRFQIPNRVIRGLQWEHLALMLKQQKHIALDTQDLEAALSTMAMEGDIQPFLDLFHERVIRAMGVKDTRKLDEKALKLMLMTYLSLSRMFLVLSEKEFAQGYCDLFLGASNSAPHAAFSWLLELKYLPTGARPAQIEKAFAEAQKQVVRYSSDAALLPLLLGNRQLKAGMLVFVGTKRVAFRPWAPGEKAPSRSPRKALGGG